MKLSGKQIGEIQEALLDAYPSEEDLRPMVRIELDENLEAIATGKNQRVLIFSLVTWAERNGRIDALVDGAYNQNPGNPALQELIRRWRATMPPVVAEAESSPAVQVSSRPASIDVFISYSRKDNESMRTVQQALREAGLAVWTDEGQGLEPGTSSWQDAISEAVSQAQAMVVLLSPDANASVWVKREINFAQTKRKRVFPLLISGDETTAIPISLIDAQRVDGRADLQQAITLDLLPTLRRQFRLPEPDAPRPDVRRQGEVSPAGVSRPVEAPLRAPTRSWFGLILGSAILVLVAGVGWWALSSFGEFRIVGPTPWPAATATAPAAGATMTNAKDDAVYVYVPAGPFIMGSSDDDPVAYDDEKPQQSDLYLDAFWIMRTEVTNAQYARCVQAGVCTEPENTLWNAAVYAEHPVTDVDWFQANDYAKWVGGRLPTEAEWEKACRGIDGRIYPWSDEQPTSDLANFDMNVGGTTPVGSYPEGASPYGVLDMAGNVWEWTSSQHTAYPYDPNDGREGQAGDADRVLRGGSFGLYVRGVRCAARVGLNPDFQNGYHGFRVVLSP